MSTGAPLTAETKFDEQRVYIVNVDSSEMRLAMADRTVLLSQRREAVDLIMQERKQVIIDLLRSTDPKAEVGPAGKIIMPILTALATSEAITKLTNPGTAPVFVEKVTEMKHSVELADS